MRQGFDFLMGLALWATLAMTLAGTVLGLLAQLVSDAGRARALHAPRAVGPRPRPPARCSRPVATRAGFANGAEHGCALAC